MNEDAPTEENLADEFRDLGKNLAELLRTGWDNPDRKRLQQQITSGITEFGTMVKREVETFTESPSGQRFRADMDEIGERLRTPETQEKIRHELIAALQTANLELQKIIDQWSSGQSTRSQDTSDSEKTDEAVQDG
jgi:hypothetical protein